MAFEEITTLIANVGFPIAITIWFMFRTEKVIAANTEAMNKNSLILEKIYFEKK